MGSGSNWIKAESIEHEARYGQAGLVDVGCVVTGFKGRTFGGCTAEVVYILLARQGGGPPAGRVAGLREIECGDVTVAGVAHGLAQGLENTVLVVQWRFALLHNDTVIAQCTVAVAVEGFGKQALGRADRVGAVDNDQVNAAGCGVFHPLDAVAEVKARARIVIGRAEFGKVLFRQSRDALVDLYL